ncbi:MAG: pyridoxamine 5'-phosphate oxidase family protein [Propionibacteriaceae bacterium]|nr:pyridoxamine 5'-phosphate oxidase family protein [Propionibacteriaceae bacterium]
MNIQEPQDGTSWRDRLRSIPAFPDEMPDFEVADAPDDPLPLFEAWLTEAMATQVRQANMMTLSTIDGDHPAARTLILKDFGPSGFDFATARTTAKARQLAERPVASMLFYWTETGRQVEVRGPVVEAPEEEIQADWLQRPSSDGQPNPNWVVYRIEPEVIEFLQSKHSRRHTRIRYAREGDAWRLENLTAPEK